MTTLHQISVLSSALAQKLPDLLSHFDINYVYYENRYSFPCPVHGGDNPGACSIFIDGVPNWSCWTHCCQETYKKNLFGFVRGVLSFKAGREINIYETIDFCSQFLNYKLEEMPKIEENLNIKKQIKLLEVFNKRPDRTSPKIDRELITKTLDIPSKYYLSRGYEADTLIKYDIGDCKNLQKAMSNRAVVPIYDENYNYVGCTGRTINDNYKPKWLNSSGLSKSQYLYGLNLAKDIILKTGIAILVEGQGDVWRAYEAGFPNTVGIMGANLSEDQLILLESSGCLNLIILTDMDDPGIEAYEKMVKKCGRRFNLYRPILPEGYKDIGDMDKQSLKQFLENFISIKGIA